MDNMEHLTVAQQFFWGFGGSLAIELLTVFKYYNSGKSLPRRYREFGYYLVRVLIAAVGGGLVIAYHIDKAILAINIGASTPLLLSSLSRRAH